MKNSVSELDQMTTAAKIRTMEMLSDDLCRRSDEITSPLWHNQVLTERGLKVSTGESSFDDWETTKGKIRELSFMKMRILDAASSDLA